MKKISRKIISTMVLGAMIFTVGGNVTYAQTVKEVKSVETVQSGFNNKVLPVSRIGTVRGANGNIVGDGVALRSQPSNSGTRLELMYDGEDVEIDYDKSWSESNGLWFYIKRLKTGTKGWVSTNYLEQWSRNVK